VVNRGHVSRLRQIVMQTLAAQSTETAKEFLIMMVRKNEYWDEVGWRPSGSWVERDLRNMKNLGLIAPVYKKRRVFYKSKPKSLKFN